RDDSLICENFEFAQNMRVILNNTIYFLSAISKIVYKNSALNKEIENAIHEKSLAMKNDLEAKFENIDGVNFLAARLDLPNADAVKTLAYALKGALNNLFLVLGAEFDGKPSLTVVVSEDLVKEKGLNAGAVIRDL